MKKVIYFTLATIAGIAIFILYAMLCTLMEWENAGGYLLLSLVFAIAVLVWRYIYGLSKRDAKV